MPEDTSDLANGMFTFTAYRQFDDLDSILSSLQDKDCIVSFGRPSAGVTTGQVGFSVMVKSAS